LAEKQGAEITGGGRRRRRRRGRGVVVVILVLAVKNATCFYGLALGENLLFVKLR
jgi:hypothetical protein